jgi:hypothetical protein
MKRAVVINFKDGTKKELLLSKATAIRHEGVDAGMLHLDKLLDGSWRLIFSDEIAKDFSMIDSFTMLRED